MRRKLILDVDTGTDDAVAIMLAALHPALDLVAVTTVNGNVEVAHCTDNSLRTLDFIGRRDIPVFEGSPRPFVRADCPVPRALRPESGIHVRELPLPAPTSVRRAKGAVEFLIEAFRDAREPITLVPTGPLTNIAAAIAADPGFVAAVPEVVIMGGGHYSGNVTASAEFNIWADPEAAAKVFAAGFERLTLVPLDATLQALITRAQAEELEALGTPAGIAASRFIIQRIKGYSATQPMKVANSAPVHDALCVAFLVAPEVVETRRVHVAVETRGDLTIGRTVMDVNRRGGGEPNCDVAFSADAARFFAMLKDTFGQTSAEQAR